MPDYKKGKIYKIECNKTGLCYYGSTTQTLNARLQQHIIHAQREGCGITSKLIIDRNDYDIHLVENVSCDNKKELLIREDYYASANVCVNSRRAYLSYEDHLESARAHYYDNHEHNKKTSLARYYKNIDARKQYYEDNKEYKAEYAREYYQKNKEKIKEKMALKRVQINHVLTVGE